MSSELTAALIDATAAAIGANTEELTSLDRAIGDGDHGINMKRGFDAILAQRDELAGLPLGQAIQKAGMTLVMKIGGASGPLYGSLLMSMGKAMPEGTMSVPALAAALGEGVAAVKKRGRSDAGEKTMLDVLVPVLAALDAAGDGDVGSALTRACAAADAGLSSTKPMRATKGRASYLGERSIGHLDPGARSSCLLVHAVADVVESRA